MAKVCQRKSKQLAFVRHTFATLALENGIDIKAIQENLGQSSISVTGILIAILPLKYEKQRPKRSRESWVATPIKKPVTCGRVTFWNTSLTGETRNNIFSHLPHIQGVAGSNPFAPTTANKGFFRKK